MRRIRYHPFSDRMFTVALFLCSAVVVVSVAVLMLVLLVQSWPAISHFGFGFLIGKTWNPVQRRFGALTFIYGTVVSSALGLTLAAVVGVAMATLLSQYFKPWITAPVAFLLELLAAIPSVVYGLWGIFVLAPWLRVALEPAVGRALGFLPVFRGPDYGVGMLAAALILAMMILPTIVAIVREVMESVPKELCEGAFALGASKHEMIALSVFPYARKGIVGAVMLGLGRALGETMAVTMVIGNRPQIAASLFAPGYSMASVLAKEFTEATSPLYLSSLYEIGLLLFVVTVLFYASARLLIWRSTGRARVMP